MTRDGDVIGLDLLKELQMVESNADVPYRGHSVHIAKVDDAPSLIYVTVSGWRPALTVNGQDTVHALAGIRDIDQLIDLIDDVVNYPPEKGN